MEAEPANDAVNDLGGLQEENTAELRERMEALRKQMEESGGLPPDLPPEQPRKANESMPTLLSRLSIALLAAGLATAPLPLLAATPQPQAESSQQDGWTINLKDADIREFVDQVADITGETFIVDPGSRARSAWCPRRR